MNSHMESREGEEGTSGHVKGHLWGFRGPPRDGQGSASGGSNFSKPWGGGGGVRFCAWVCLRAVSVCMWCDTVCVTILGLGFVVAGCCVFVS